MAIGNPGEASGGQAQSGAVSVLYGTSANGLTEAGDDRFHQNASGIPDTSEAGDRYGFSLTSGDYNNDGFDDLVIGVPLEDVGTEVDAGAINVIYGSAAGLDSTQPGTDRDSKWFDQNDPEFDETAEGGDRFGFSLTTGDFNFDGHADLAVGVPFEDLTVSGNNIWDAGVVHEVHGKTDGFAFPKLWHQNSSDAFGSINEVAQVRDFFGFSLASGNLDSDPADDLVVGVPNEGVFTNGVFTNGVTVHAAGAISVIYGLQKSGATENGLTTLNDDFRHQNSTGIVDAAEARDRFGTSVAVGSFSGSGFADVVVGVPLEDIDNRVNAGAVNVLRGATNGIVNPNSQLWHLGLGEIDGPAADGDRYGSIRDAAIFSNYDIDFRFLVGEANTPPLAANEQELFREAADRWQEVILGDLQGVIIDFGNGVLVPVDDILIDATAGPIDQQGNTAAATTTSRGFNRPAGWVEEFLPFYGRIEMDVADVPNLLASEQYFDVVLHELGHALGFNSATLLDTDSAEDGPDVAPDADQYIGAAAVAEFNQLLGATVTEIELAPGGGHWTEGEFGQELLSPSFSAADDMLPLSRVTSALMVDIGYVADIDAADFFALPPAPGALPSGGATAGSLAATPFAGGGEFDVSQSRLTISRRQGVMNSPARLANVIDVSLIQNETFTPEIMQPEFLSTTSDSKSSVESLPKAGVTVTTPSRFDESPFDKVFITDAFETLLDELQAKS